MRPVKF